MDQLREWTVKEVSKLRSYSMNTKPITKSNNEIADYLVKKDENFVESYVVKLFGNTTATKTFVRDFLLKRRAIKSDSAYQKPPATVVAPKGMMVLHSKKEDDFEVPKKKAPAKPKGNVQRNQKQQKKESDAMMQCDCFGTVHKALTNCLNCGRIVCEKEGYGPCKFCGCPVTKDAAGSELYANSKDAEKAIELRNRLIKYDKTAAKRTTIYDDQEDYFTTSPWLSSEEIKAREERAKQHELDRLKREENKKKMFISFNFGGQVVSVVSGLEIAEKEEEERERDGEIASQKKKRYDDSDSDDDNNNNDDDDDTINTDEVKDIPETKERNDDNNNNVNEDTVVDDDEEETEIIVNEEFCPVKPKNVPFGVASNLSIAAPVYRPSEAAKSEGIKKESNNNDPFSGISDKSHHNRVQHDYFTD